MDKPNFNLQLAHIASKSTEKKQILDNRNCKNTNRATRSNIMEFTEYLKDKQLPSIKEIQTEDLHQILYIFYPQCIKTDGDEMEIDNKKFIKANEMYCGDSKQLREKGKAAVKSYQVINEDDLKRIYKYFDHDIMNQPDPRKIQRCVIFDTIYFFCHHGRENLYTMTWDQFKISFDSNGHHYVYQAIDEFNKNHRIDDTDPANQARMYEQASK